MSFKDAYRKWLKETLTELLPSGYSIKVIEEIGAGSKANSKYEIKCYVKFGAASKQNNTKDRINQPIIFNIFSEADDFKVAIDLFDMFFLTYSKIHTVMNVKGINYNLWHFYNSPSVNSAFMQIGEYGRANILMTGVISYSTEKITGVKWYIDGEEIQVVNPQIQFNSEAETPNFLNDDYIGKANILASNNTFGFNMLLDKSNVASKLRDTAISGKPYSGTLKIEYSDKTYEIKVRTTMVILVNDVNTGDNLLNVTLMPVEV